MDLIDNYFPLKYRLLFGVTSFVIFGLFDFYKNPSNPKRAKEYCFLLSLAFVSIIFAIFHDFITFQISREYFEVGKGLGRNIRFFPDIIVLATKASYWVGILIGVFFLVANNPRENKPQLRYRLLYKKLLIPFLSSLIFGIVGYFLSYIYFPYFSQGGEDILVSPKKFEQVAFIHIGTYIGALVGSILGAILIIRKREALKLS